MSKASSSSVREKVKGVMYGVIIGDALGMPVHWYYKTENLKHDYGVVDHLMAPKEIHPESMVSGMSYKGTIDILHDKAMFYEGYRLDAQANPSWSVETKVVELKSAPNVTTVPVPIIEQAVAKDDRVKAAEAESQTKAKFQASFAGDVEADRAHYHGSLKKGQNTNNVCIARLLSRYLVKSCKLSSGYTDGYNPANFIQEFYDYATWKNIKGGKDEVASDIAQLKCSNDIYFDVYFRYFFTQASKGIPLMLCGHNQRDAWSVGSLDGIVMAIPLVLAYINQPEATLVARAIEHQTLTHRSITVTAGIVAIVPLLKTLIFATDLTDDEFDELLDVTMDKFRPPKITAGEMSKSYFTYKGPGNIPKNEKWSQHNTLSEISMKEEIRGLVAKDLNDEQVMGWNAARFSSACYVEQGLSAIFYLLCKYGSDTKKCLQVNANLGGHTTARGSLLGAILGAKNGPDSFPADWKTDLAAPQQIQREVEGIVDLAMNMQ